MSRIVVSKKRKKKEKPQYDWDRVRTRPFTAFEEFLNKMKTFDRLAEYLYPPIDWRAIQDILQKRGIDIGEPTAKKIAWRLSNRPEFAEKRQQAYELAEDVFNLKIATGLTVSECLALHLFSQVMLGKATKEAGAEKVTREIEDKAIDLTWEYFFNDWEMVMKALELSRVGTDEEKLVTYLEKLLGKREP